MTIFYQLLPRALTLLGDFSGISWNLRHLKSGSHRIFLIGSVTGVTIDTDGAHHGVIRSTKEMERA